MILQEKATSSLLSDLIGRRSNGFATGLYKIRQRIKYLFQQNYIMCYSDIFENLDYHILNTNLAAMNFSLEENLKRHVLLCLDASL